MELKAIDGRLSKNYNIFQHYQFQECLATNTRLMGVVALKITWVDKENTNAHLYQIIHLDFSEYGIDDYFEYECVSGRDDFLEKKNQAIFQWESFVRVMGGDVIDVSPEIMVASIESVIDLAKKMDDENNDFRRNALQRLDMMISEIEKENLIKSKPSTVELIKSLSKKNLTATETINYFLMRLVDLDFNAAAYLSTINIEKLKSNILTRPGIQTLVKNKIRLSRESEDIASDGMSFPYRCNLTTLSDMSGYYYASFVVYLDLDYRSKDAKVTEIKIGSMNKLSTYEAASQLQITEYITVYDCRDRILHNFDGSHFTFLVSIDPVLVNNGWLYTIYNKDNSHVNKADYWLNDDVYGYAILTIDGEFVLMSNKVDNIEKMEEDVAMSMYAPMMRLDGRYQLDSPIFHTLCHKSGVMFKDLIEEPDE